MKPHFFYYCLILAFWACSEAPAPNRRELACYARFDASTQTVKAEATIKEGPTAETLVPISPEKGFRFQESEMRLLPHRGLTYTAQKNIAYQPELSFGWEEPVGSMNHFKVALPKLDSFYFDEPTLSNTQPATLRWTGGSLQRGETLVLMWENRANGKTAPMEVYDTDGLDFLKIPAAKMKELEPGNWSLYLVRRRLTKSKVGTVEASGTGEYYTQPKELIIDN